MRRLAVFMESGLPTGAAGILAWLLLISPWVRANDLGVPLFVDITDSSGVDFLHINGVADRKDYIFEAKGGGVGLFDYDNDGWLDLVLVQGSTMEMVRTPENQPSRLYRNLGNGRFEDVTGKAGLTYRFWGMGVTFGDYNNDGFADVYITHLGPNVLYRNNGDGTFTDVTEKAGVGDPRWSTSAAFGDYDNDGSLDLYVANYLDYGVDKLPPISERCKYLGHLVMCGPRGLDGAAGVLYHNNGDGTFSDVTEKSGAVDREKYFSLGVIWSDLDNDGDLDLLVGNDATPNLLFVNRGDGTFDEQGFLSGLAVSKNGSEQASMGIDVADYDNDGLLDVFMTHFAADYSTLYRNEGDLIFSDVTGEALLVQPTWLYVSWSTRFFDVNLDGWKDLFHSNGHVYPFLLNTPDLKETYRQGNSLYVNAKDGTFVDVSAVAGEAIRQEKVSRGVAFGDIDNDGDIDLVVANLNDSPQILRNDRRDANHWMMVRTIGARSNRDGIGAKITVTAGGLRQVWEIKRTVGIYSASDPRAHFGLGQANKADSLEIHWPSGKVEKFSDVPADVHYVLDESKGLSREEFKGR